MLRLATHAMGTRFELVLDGAREMHLRAAGEAAIDAIEECDRRFSLFRSDSLVRHLERNAARDSVKLDEDTFELFEICRDVHRLSRGAFDITVAPLMRSLGFHGDGEPLETAQNAVGAEAIELDCEQRTIRLARAGIAIDLGAIGKGHALELAGRILREAGVESALMHGGTSSVVAIGSPRDIPAWRVAIEGGARSPVAELNDAALSVSAQHGRRLANGAGHVLDPRSQRSADSSDVVAVIHSDARVAEAWSTALLVLGEIPDEARELDVAIGSGPRFAREWRIASVEGARARFTCDTASIPSR